MKKLYSTFFIMICLLLLLASISCNLLDRNLKVKRTIDGDTIILSDGRHVRLIGINTSEMHYNTPRPPEPFAVEARNFVDSLATGKKCYLEFDPIGDKVDKYGRTLAFVFILPDSVFLNAMVIKSGYSKVFAKYPFRKDYKKLFYQYQNEARQDNRAIWR